MTGDEVKRVWRRSRPINYPKQVEIAGGIAAPLLAGFSLTIVTELVLNSNHPELNQYAIGCFAVSSVLFVYCLQLTAFTLGFAATPSERLDYNPEARSEPDVLQIVRARQWEESELRQRYGARAGHCYNAGIVTFLGGLALVMVPHHWKPWPWGVFVGLLVVGCAVAIELTWWLSGATRPRWLLPQGTKGAPDDLSDFGRAYLFDSESVASTAATLNVLSRLHDSGALSADEFDRQKTRLLHGDLVAGPGLEPGT